MIATILQQATQNLATSSDTPRLDAEVLLCHVLDRSRSYLYTYPQQSLSPEQQQAFDALLGRRIKGEPIAYLLGHREFWSLDLEVTPHTLIPRPDTECLLEWVLAHYPHDAVLKIADLGTGSGAIALAIANECPKWQLSASDQSEAALEVAMHNAKRLHLPNVSFYQGSWCHALPHRDYDVIISNPPYIAEQDPHLAQADLRFEPQQALVAGADGLSALTTIIKQAPSYLRRGGCLVLEHGYDQAEAVSELLKQAQFTNIQSHRDYAAQPRYLTATSIIS